jgi:hypothetical protein
MNTTDSDRLLLEYLDGTATPAERARVEAWLAGAPAARARRAELEGLFAELASLPTATPPPDLRQRVLAEIGARERAASRAPSTAREHHTHPRPAFFGRRPALTAGLAFAAGLAVGALALGGARSGMWLGTTDPAQVSGTMGSAESAPTAPVIARLEGASMTGNASAIAGAGRAEIDLEIPDGFTAELADPSGSRVFAGVRRSGASLGAVRMEGERVEWTGPASGRFEVEFTAPPTASGLLRISLLSPSGSSNVELPVHSPTRR